MIMIQKLIKKKKGKKKKQSYENLLLDDSNMRTVVFCSFFFVFFFYKTLKKKSIQINFGSSISLSRDLFFLFFTPPCPFLILRDVPNYSFSLT
jgi:hypothetical protein